MTAQLVAALALALLAGCIDHDEIQARQDAWADRAQRARLEATEACSRACQPAGMLEVRGHVCTCRGSR